MTTANQDHTTNMKKVLIQFGILAALTGAVFGQNVRYDSEYPSISATSPPFLVANTPPNSPILQVCQSPANGLPCSNFATTYTSSGAACPNGAQDTPQPQPSACQPTGDAQGNVGFWAPAGKYDIVVCIANDCGNSPYTVTLGGSGGGGSGTVTSVTPGTGLTSSPNPIVETGTISLIVPVSAANGGTGLNTSGSNGIAQVLAGVWSASYTVPSLSTTGALAVGGVLSIAGLATGCVNIAAGVVGSTGIACGSGGGSGTPGGLPFQFQTNSGGSAFGGITNTTGAPAPFLSQGTSAYPINVQGINYATTQQNWSQTGITTSCTAGSPCTITLTNGPSGIDTTGTGMFQVYVSDSSNSETVAVTGGTCTLGGGSSCTIIFTPFFNHPAATSYTVMSATSGILETYNLTAGISTGANIWHNGECNVTIPSNGTISNNNATYNMYGTVFMHGQDCILSGYGVKLNMMPAERGPAISVTSGLGVTTSKASGNKVEGFKFITATNFSPSNANVPAFYGCDITNIAATSGVWTITTATACGFRVGDLVNVQFTDDHRIWGDSYVASTPTTTTFTVTKATATTVSSVASPGQVALAFEAILDNGQHTYFQDLGIAFGQSVTAFNNDFDFWDDEAATVSGWTDNSVGGNHNLHWNGCEFYSGGEPISGNWAPVVTVRDSSLTANGASGFCFYNSNGLYIKQDVVQATGLWQVFSADYTGNFQGAEIEDMYGEGVGANGANATPFQLLGVAGLIAGGASSGADYSVKGTGGLQGATPGGGSGATPYTYYIVAHDVTAGTYTSPLPILGWLSTGSDSIPVNWPRIANQQDTITYDVIRMTSPGGVITPTNPYPYAGGCPGGSGGTCGSVVTGLSQATACSGTLICTYTDTGSSTTSAYTIQQGQYSGNINFWPGPLVVQNNVVISDQETVAIGIGASNNPLQVSLYCSQFGFASPGGYTTCLSSKRSPNNSVVSQTALLLGDGADNTSNPQGLVTGRLDFPLSPYANTFYPHDIITLQDSNPSLTEATGTYRRLLTANDTGIGTDGPNTSAAGYLDFHSQHSITDYINSLPSGSGWLRRLTASLDELNVPVQMDSTVKIISLADGCLNIASGVVGSFACGAGSVTSVATGAGLTGGTITSTGTISVLVGGITDTLASLSNKPSAGVVSVSNITLSGIQTIDGVSGTAGVTIVLCTAQTTGSQNGPWIMQSGAWTRPSWYPSAGTTQAFQFITERVRLGTVYGGSEWKMTTSGAITIDTSSTTWTVDPAIIGPNTFGGAVFAAIFPALTGDVTNTAGSLATIVGGLDGMPFCSGFTPANNQQLEYTTALSPNPCYTAVFTGVLPNAQTGTTYTYVTGDRASYVTFSNASAVAVTLPQSGSTGFGSNWVNKSCNIGAGTVTITPTTSHISYTSGTGYTASATSVALTTGVCAWIYSDNTNYFANLNGGIAHVITIAVAGSPIATGQGNVAAPSIANFACTINKASILSPISGSITVEIWKANLAIPTSGNKISASAPVTLSSAQINNSSSLSGWTTSVASGDVFWANVATADGILTQATVELGCQ